MAKTMGRTDDMLIIKGVNVFPTQIESVLMGIDHIGLGTDFDGDGGIPGLADSSDMLNFTRELLLHEFTEDDIRKIWGGNWLRVMKEVQAAADKK